MNGRNVGYAVGGVVWTLVCIFGGKKWGRSAERKAISAKNAPEVAPPANNTTTEKPAANQ